LKASNNKEFVRIVWGSGMHLSFHTKQEAEMRRIIVLGQHRQNKNCETPLLNEKKKTTGHDMQLAFQQRKEA
jgi:hypothetical protein